MAEIMIILAAYYFMLYVTVFWFLVLFKNRDRLFNDPAIRKYPGVSIIIPAFNEEKNIETAVRSCLELDYPKNRLEVIVVDDGSTDGTAEVCKKFGSRIRLVRKKNGGKAAALNTGISIAKHELIGCLDADSFFEKNSLKPMIGYFRDKNVGAVTAAMKAKDAGNLNQKIQYIEYLFSIYLRKMMSFLNVIYVTPGPGSVYRKSVLNEAGGFDANNIVEDTDIALKIQKLGYRIENSLNAFVYTETPRSWRGLFKQRIRWYSGYLENVLGKHRDIMFNRKFPHLGWFLLPTSFIWLFVIFFLAVTMAIDLLSSAVIGLRNLIFINFDINPMVQNFSSDIFTPQFIFGFLIIFYILSIIVLYFSVKLSRESQWKEKKMYFIFYLFIYFTLLAALWIVSAVVFVKRKALGDESQWKGEKVN